MLPPTFDSVLSAAVAERGLTLDRLQERLVRAGVPVSVATLSYWQSGRSLPARRASLQTLPVLEAVLGLPPGHLTQHLPSRPSRRPTGGRARVATRATGSAEPAEPPEALVPVGEQAAAIMSEWGLDLTQRLTRLSIQDRQWIGEDRADGPINTRSVWRAEVDGVSSFPAVYVQDVEGPRGSEPLPPLTRGAGPAAEFGVVAVTSCSVGRVARVDEVNLLVVELCFPTPLRRGEVVMTEHMFVPWPSGRLSDRIQRGIVHPMREVVLEAHFHPKATPARAFRYRRAVVDGPEIELSEVAVNGAVAQTVFVDVDRGTAGLRWEW